MDRPILDLTDRPPAPAQLPMVLADLHRDLPVDAPVEIAGAGPPEELVDLVVGAGFTVEASEVDADVVRVLARRALTLADTVGADMRVLVCGLNPSLYAAARGVGYARPGNRFWKAVVAAGLVAPHRALDPRAVLVHHGIGITDLVKRATVTSAELSADEYRDGAARVERLVRRLQPRVVAFVGFEGWRAAVDRKATAGRQPDDFGGRPAYVLPSTSGLNAHSRLDDLVAHFRAVAALADR